MEYGMPSILCMILTEIILPKVVKIFSLKVVLSEINKLDSCRAQSEDTNYLSKNNLLLRKVFEGGTRSRNL